MQYTETVGRLALMKAEELKQAIEFFKAPDAIDFDNYHTGGQR